MFANPFRIDTLHPLAVQAAKQLQTRLSQTDLLEGKMFGVLVVATADNTLDFLYAFSGMLNGEWCVDGFVPPVFSVEARNAFWPQAEAELSALDYACQTLLHLETPLQNELQRLESIYAEQLRELQTRHSQKRQQRKILRLSITDAAELHALDQQSRADAAEIRDLKQSHNEACLILKQSLEPIVEQHATLEAQRNTLSQQSLGRIQADYVFANIRGELKALRALFAPHEPPGGAGDCAAPKLLSYAFNHGLRPIALAEFWWGPPPAGGGRNAGQFYPACRGKCGPILEHMLAGLCKQNAPVFGNGAIDAAQPRTIYEDTWLVVVEKPCGLLSVPGRSAELSDAVSTRLRARYPDATGPLVVHRLDLDTSGLLLAAKDIETYAMLQRLFAQRLVHKRYVALLAGDVAGESGVIELPMRVDFDDRPRQIVDAVHGKAALTEWRVLSRTAGKTRVALMPRTGRTHQLRVHAAHALGLGAPIVGDRLYGTEAARLMLHAEALEFVHPRTGESMAFLCEAEF